MRKFDAASIEMEDNDPMVKSSMDMGGLAREIVSYLDKEQPNIYEKRAASK
jgi:hypothetical protein